jgi:hypothetical protein
MSFSAALVLMMTSPGLALFYCGLVRRRNVLDNMMQSFVMMTVVTLIWAICGHSLVFAQGNALLGDLRYAFLHEAADIHIVIKLKLMRRGKSWRLRHPGMECLHRCSPLASADIDAWRWRPTIPGAIAVSGAVPCL